MMSFEHRKVWEIDVPLTTIKLDTSRTAQADE
ncbi:hypothetical protein EAF56_15475 [Vibrio alginolyticus]|uniref:Uncharacterized protein n=1 Tax=Vibrio alginolyticus TaxID=663 RepID=A0AA36XML9_VIBAL|nr:hypothetical protein [Vibrio alginolyticus]EGR1166561.1 hypothetical protein [Vibrio parahaemolyticus]EGR1171299.1 hypothetical protein [Vibrio parahaemolyticus]EGR1297408.1 hypothetical protein [Vibrio alginolyticus]EGR1595976.1 hypothetical protein [Vibrio parahaemolyticus]